MTQTTTQDEILFNLTETEKATRMGVSVTFLQKDRLKAEPIVPFKRYGRMVRYANRED